MFYFWSFFFLLQSLELLNQRMFLIIQCQQIIFKRIFIMLSLLSQFLNFVSKYDHYVEKLFFIPAVTINML